MHNFNRDGFEALYPRYRGVRPRSFMLPQHQAIKRCERAEFRIRIDRSIEQRTLPLRFMSRGSPT
jgi:hypothetical protein